MAGMMDQRRKRLYVFYDVNNDDALLERMEQHVERLVEKVRNLREPERVRTHVREG